MNGASDVWANLQSCQVFGLVLESLGVVDAGFDDGCFVLLLTVVVDDEAVAFDGELYLFADGDVGGF